MDTKSKIPKFVTAKNPGPIDGRGSEWNKENTKGLGANDDTRYANNQTSKTHRAVVDTRQAKTKSNDVTLYKNMSRSNTIAGIGSGGNGLRTIAEKSAEYRTSEQTRTSSTTRPAGIPVSTSSHTVASQPSLMSTRRESMIPHATSFGTGKYGSTTKLTSSNATRFAGLASGTTMSKYSENQSKAIDAKKREREHELEKESSSRRKVSSAMESMSSMMTAFHEKHGPKKNEENKDMLVQQLQTEQMQWRLERQQFVDKLAEVSREKAVLLTQLDEAKTQNVRLESKVKEHKMAHDSEREFRRIEVDMLAQNVADLEDERDDMRKKMSQTQQEVERLTAANNSTKAQIQQERHRLQVENTGLRQKLQKVELIRRRLHNEIQDLKGNIRVFCRVRPRIASENTKDEARIAYPDDDIDCRQVVLYDVKHGHNRTNSFTFDRVFGQTSRNEDVFLEMSQLVQSALDGYNVCIFAYGQTGSGKTYTMSYPQEGMIPRAVTQIFETTQELRELGWEYELTGEFVEIYNESLRDLLSVSNYTAAPQKKLEIRHDPSTNTTSVTNLTVNKLDSIEVVQRVLRIAEQNRSVATTRLNERSSRSHSVFTLRITGRNKALNKTCNGTLNLIDLAGSERLSESQTEGAQRRETQHINKSLSALGDVIYALGKKNQSNGHVPYRNSKLTYLLQYSLSGSSKTLMLVNVSPLSGHLDETLSSLRFASNVNATRLT